MKSFVPLLLAIFATASLASDPEVPRVAATDGEGLQKLHGQRAVAYGTVERTNDYQGRMTFVNFPGQVFTVVCFSANYDRFEKPPAELLAGKYVEIIGIVTDYKGKLQIVLESPEQLLKVEAPPAGGNGGPQEPREEPEEEPEVVDPKRFFDE